MTTLVEARSVLVTLVYNDLVVNYPDLLVVWENTLDVDLDQVPGNMFLRVEVDFTAAEQLTIDGPVDHATHGLLWFTVMIREGSGTVEALTLLQHLATLTKFQLISNVALGCPFFPPGRAKADKGWTHVELGVYFRFDSND